MNSEEANIAAVDPKVNKPSKPTGKGSQKKRFDAFKTKKNDEFYERCMAGIFSRLKIKDPTAVPQLEIQEEQHPVTVPVTFKHVPDVVNRVWDEMASKGPRPFATLNTPENKNIFTKGMLILSEVKVCYAQKAHINKPDETLSARKLYTDEELRDLNSMAQKLPVSLSIMLENIGNTSIDGQTVTPVLAGLRGDDAPFSGTISYGPRELVAFLNLCANGFQVNTPIANAAARLNMLPGIEWEEAQGICNLTQRSRDFWLTEARNGVRRLKWSDDEYRLFRQIVNSVSSVKDFVIPSDLSHGDGDLSQTVQFEDWIIDESVRWYTMANVPAYSRKIAAAFGFGDFGVDNNYLVDSRFLGTLTTSVWRGEVIPRRVLNALVEIN